MEEKKIAKIKKNNMKLYPIYKMIGLDFIFYYGIEVLFLTQVKQIAPSDIVLASSIFAFFCIAIQVPLTAVITKIGKRNSLVLGNSLNFISVLCIMLAQNFGYIIIAQFISAIGFGLKGVAESNLLNYSMPEAKNKEDIFSSIDGKGYARYCFIAATSTLISGFLYDINPYIPICLTLFCILFATILSANFIDLEKIDKNTKKTKQVTMKQTVHELKIGFKFIFQSSRLKGLLLMLGMIWGLLCLFSTYQTTLLKELQISASVIGILLASLQILTGITSKKATAFHNRFRNKTLSILAFCCTIGVFFAGIVVIFKIPFILQIVIILMTYSMRASAKGVFQIIKKRYMANFADSTILPSIYASNIVINNVARMMIALIGSTILKYCSIQVSMVVAGIFFTIVVSIVSHYMKTRVGLKPEQYRKEDIQYRMIS